MTTALSSDSNTRKRTAWLLVSVLLVSLVLTLWSQWPHLWDRYRVIKDVQNYYWMALYQDPTLFPVDYLYPTAEGRVIAIDILEYQFLLFIYSPGYGLLFFLASFLIEYIWLSKLLVFALMLLCVVYLFQLGKSLGGDSTALNLSLLFVFIILASPQSISIASGLQRAFTVPMLIVFLYYMVARKYVWAALMILVGILIYAPAFPLMTLAYALSLVTIERPFRLSWHLTRSRLMPYAAALLLSSLVFLSIMASRQGWFVHLAPSSHPTPSVGSSSLPVPDTTQEDVPIYQLPRYQTGGSVPLFAVFPWFGRAGVFDIGADVLNFFVLLLFAVLICLVLGVRSLRRLPSPFWCLLIAGILMYGASLFAVLRLSTRILYLPSRYTRVTLVLVTLCFVGVNWADFWSSVSNWLQRNSRLLIFFVVSLGVALTAGYMFFPTSLPLMPALLLAGLTLRGMLTILGGGFLVWIFQRPIAGILGRGGFWKKIVRIIGLLAVCVVTALSGATYIRTLETSPINPSQAARDVYEFVGTLPKDVILAGESDVMTGIPAFSRRSVLFRRLFPSEDAPIVEFFDAQYAESPEPVLSFCERYGVDYLVTDAGVFDPDYIAEGKFFYQPYNDQIVELVAGRSDFVLSRVQPVFSSDSLSVIKCDAETLLAEE